MSISEEATNRYAKLSLAKQVLLQRRLRGEVPGGKRRNVIRRRQNRETSPLSFAQQRLWFLDQLDSSRAYNIPKPVRLVGSLCVDALERALSEIIRRHEMLRTVFVERDGSPVQVLKAQEQFTLPSTDLSHMAERETEMRRVAIEEAHRPFDLTAGPLLRVQLLRLAEAEHVVLFTMHHIISDGWSLGVLVKEVAALYEAYVNGEESPLPELEIQYADYAAWQREWLQGEVLEEQLSYWRRQLGGELPVLELPADRPRPAVQSYRGGRQSITLSEELTQQLKALSQREGCTLFMTLLAAFQILLSRYTGQDDIVVGTPIANRTRSEVEPLIGFFVNTLALRTDLSGDPSFRELLQRVREVTLEAHAHQDLPFEKLVEELQPERDLSRTPVFQVMFALQNMPLDSLSLPGLRLVSEQIENLTSKFDLNLSTNEIGNGLHLVCEYSTELFEQQTIERLLGHYQRVLEGVSTDAEQRVWEVRLLNQDEDRQLVEWNETKRDYEQRGQCLHQLIEAQAEQTPDAVAVIYEDDEFTYGELNERANQLAHHLRGFGVGPEVLVGVCLERSVEMVVSLLAVLKAGGAYVPLDPAYPCERLSYMLTDVSVLLTHSQLLTKLPVPGELPVVRVDQDWRLIATQRCDNPESGVGPDNLAYVIYTSGSTGRPKGVMIPHEGICNRLLWMQETYNLNVFDRVLQKTTFSFDVSVWEFFWPLMAGAALVVAEPEGHRDSAYLVKLISEQAITTLHFVPSMLQVFLKEKELAACRSLERVICSGEALPFDLQQRFFATLNSGLHNLYGPTEASIDVSYWECRRNSNSTTVPIGYPIANTELYVLDRHGQAVPVGVVGELHIGGLGLARGYLQRPELSAEKFIPDRFSGREGARLYRTGDLVRYLAGGEIEFVGRIDEQVKLRGYRIELGEIEAALTEQKGIREAVVIARAEEQRLVGYVVSDEEVKVDELRQALRAKLPEYMVPSVLVVLEALPLTANGKLDRKALPAPDAIASTEKYVAPRTPVEEVLAGIYGEVLKLGQVSINDNFFELGGHSLLATRLVSKVREAFQIELPLRRVFESPAVAGMAVVIERELRAGAGSIAPPIRAVGRDGKLPLSFAQQRLWFLEQLETGGALYNIPLAVRLTGALSLDAFKQTLSEIIRRHESLRTRFATVDGKPVQVIDAAEPLQLTPIELSGLAESELEAEVLRLARAEGQQRFDLARGPLLRVQLLRLGEEDHVVLFTMHHIISDGWSLGVLVKEVAALYDAYIKGETSPLPELEIQYADYAAWQREWLQGEVLEDQLHYWQRQLGGELPVLELPADHPRPAVQTHNGARYSRLIPTADSIKALSVQQGSTLFMTLLTVFATLLHYLTKQTDITVGTDIANRNRAETENLIGFFVNQLVLRVQIEQDLTFKALLGKVREATLGAYAHQDLPFEKLVETLNPDRDASRSPLFQVKMVLQNAPFEELRIPGVTLSPVKTNSNTAKFDLLLNLYDTDHGLSAILDYNTDLFEEHTATRILDQFCFLLDDVVERPDVSLRELMESLTENDKRAQLEKEKELDSLRLQKLRIVKRRSIGETL